MQFDALPSELKGLKPLNDLVVLELKNGETTQLVTTLAEFQKLSSNIDKVLEEADGLRGRRKGYRPSQTKE